jgi:hypothetical protein
MTDPLFSDRARTDARTKRPGEGSFDFYERVDSPFFAEVRTELCRWFVRYPSQEQEDLRRRLFDDDLSEAALWELIVHELYRVAGYHLEAHPEVDGTTRRPDFLVTRGDETFLLEARVVTATSDARRRRDRRLDSLIKSINKRAKPYAFYTQLKLLKEGVQQPPTAKLVRELEAWLDEVDRTFSAEQLRVAAASHAFPSRDFAAADWKLRFVALPVAVEKRGRLKGPMIGVHPIETGGSEPGARIQNAVSKKGSRYGTDVPYPLVVALAIEELGAHIDEDIAVALFGQTPWTPNGREDGYWSGRRNAGLRVGGVLTMDHPRPWKLPRLQPRLWLNPWATKPLLGDQPWATMTVAPETGELDEAPARATTSELLGLAEDWPPGPAFRR